MATKQFYHDIDLVKVGQLVNARIQNVTTAEKTTLGSELGADNVGLQVWDTDIGAPFIWDGSAWVRDALVVTGDVVFKGVINPTNVGSVEKVNGYQYVVDTAGDISSAGITFSPSAVVEVGDVVLFTSATEASVFQRNTELATETSQGIVELATQVEVDAGVDTSRVVTAATLAGSQLAADVASNASDIASLQTFTGEGTALDTVATDLAAAINELHGEIVNNDSDIAALQSSLAAEITRATSAESTLQSNIDTEEAARIAGDSDLGVSLAAEIARAQAAEAGLDSDITALQAAVNTNITAQITALEAAHDSDVASLNAAIAAEVSRATSAESTLQSNIDAEEAARIAGDSDLNASLVAEIARAQAAESAIEAAHDSDVLALNTALAAEVSRATSAESTLQSNIDAEEAARIAGDSDLNASIVAEVARAQAAEATLQSNLDSDVSALTSSLAAEVTRATAAEATLQSNLDSDVADLSASIAANAAAIAGNDSDISALQSSVGTLESATQIKAYSNDNVSLTANTALTLSHNLALTDKDFFTIRVADSNSSSISVDVDAVDANSITVTSAVSITGVKVFIMGV